MQKSLAPDWAKYLTFAWPELGPQKPLPETAVYDLENQPTTFDFVAWAVMAKTLGAKHVHFVYEGKIQDWKYAPATAWKRFGNIVLPICELMGLPWTLGKRKTGFTVGYHFGQVEALYKKLGRIEKVPLIEGPKNYVTITIRDSFRNKHRDSNRKEWDYFADWLERHGERVEIIEDGETDGYLMAVERRLRLYSNARMNFGVNNGPMALCAFSEAPYLICKMTAGHNMDDFLSKGGFPPGSQFSFRNDKQTILWAADTFENLVGTYDTRMAA